MKPIKGRKQKRVGYAAVVNMRKILAWNRAGKLPPKLTTDKLIELGITQGDVFHVKNALEDLTFLDKDGYVTPLFASMARVSEAEYRDMLKEVIHRVYSEALDNLPNLARATQAQFYNAFSVYEFPRQHRKMIALFKELCDEAGLLEEAEMLEVLNVQSNGAHPNTLQETSELDTANSAEGDLDMVGPSSTPQVNGSVSMPNYAKADELGELVIRLLQLPQSPGWTEADREWWQQAVYSASTRLSEELKGRMKP